MGIILKEKLSIYKNLTSRTCDIGWNYFNTNPFLLKTCLISDAASLRMFKAQISGVTGFLRYFKNFGTINGKKK